MDRETVYVYVRLGPNDNDSVRLVSFPRPDRVPVSKWLDLGIAIDGNRILFSVLPYVEGGYAYPDFSDEEWSHASSLDSALAVAERTLLDFLDGYGYDVEFR